MLDAGIKKSTNISERPIVYLDNVSKQFADNDVKTVDNISLTIYEGHVSRPLSDALLDEALAVLCMTESHRAMIQLQAAHPPKNLFLFREFMPQRGDKEIADPYGGSLKAYEAARDEMVEAIPSLVEFLKTRLASGGGR